MVLLEEALGSSFFANLQKEKNDKTMICVLHTNVHKAFVYMYVLKTMHI